LLKTAHLAAICVKAIKVTRHPIVYGTLHQGSVSCFQQPKIEHGTMKRKAEVVQFDEQTICTRSV
jgi:hypothetical protein